MWRRWSLFLALVVGCGALAGCGGDDAFDVTTTVVSSEYTQDIWVTGPDAVDSDEWGSWPVVYLMHGIGGSGENLSVMAAELAQHGVVVFAPDYRSTESWNIEQDAECGYRYSMMLATDYGGDPSIPVLVGHSMGASVGLLGGMADQIYGPAGSYDVCYDGTPRPDLVIPIAGCHYEYQGSSNDFSTALFSNQDARIVMVVGDEDEVCAPWQTIDAAAALEADGFDTEVIEVEGGDHSNVVFFEVIDGEWVSSPDDPIGAEVVEIILEAMDTPD